MLRKITGISVPSMAALAAAPGAAPTQLPVPYHRQTENNWCWAACAQMVFEYYHTNSLQQCDLASGQFGQVCCANPSSAACDQGEWPDDVYPKYAMGFVRLNSSMSLSDVTTEISNQRPVEVYYAWSGNAGAHVALIVGVFPNGDVWVHDPWYGSGQRAFSFVQSAYNLGSWTISYSSIQPVLPKTASTGSTASRGVV
jgi:hypothetical protein